jgi:hypothetical protein
MSKREILGLGGRAAKHTRERTMTNFTCEKCGDKCDTIICDPCHKETLAILLNSAGWVAVAKTRTGDLAGETLFDTIKREFDAS